MSRNIYCHRLRRFLWWRIQRCQVHGKVWFRSNTRSNDFFRNFGRNPKGLNKKFWNKDCVSVSVKNTILVLSGYIQVHYDSNTTTTKCVLLFIIIILPVYFGTSRFNILLRNIYIVLDWYDFPWFIVGNAFV